MHFTFANKDVLVSKERLLEFYGNISTEEGKKEIAYVDTDHYLVSDGWYFYDFVNA